MNAWIVGVVSFNCFTLEGKYVLHAVFTCFTILFCAFDYEETVIDNNVHCSLSQNSAFLSCFSNMQPFMLNVVTTIRESISMFSETISNSMLQVTCRSHMT